MKRLISPRTLKWVGAALLFTGVMQACSADDSSSLVAPSGPPTIGSDDGGGVPTLDCNRVLVVIPDLTNWSLRPPGFCGSTPQCGTILVSLLDAAGNVLAKQASASTAVALDLARLNDDQLAAITQLKAELIDDAGHSAVVTDGGQGSFELGIHLFLPTDCAAEAGNARAGGATIPPGAAGAGGSPAGEVAGAPPSEGGAAPGAGGSGVSGTGGAGGALGT